MRFLYTFFIHCYTLAIAIASFFNQKARLLREGRKATFPFLSQQCKNKQIVWFHCASLGEFEQGKPLIERIKSQNPNKTILVTFFSPSGYEVKKNDKVIDILAYLPSDTPRHARQFIEIVKPETAFFIKYEYWFNYMNVLSDSKIPFYYVSAIYRPTQYFFKPYGKWFAQQLQKCSYFFVQNQTSLDLLQSINIQNVTITGDTRFDRVHAIASRNETLPFMEEFRNNHPLIIAGSSWEPDEQLLENVFAKMNNDYKMVIAPHLIDNNHINNIVKLFSSYKVIRYSERDTKNLTDYNVLIIDTIGLLSKIYKYADIAYIGGAFATGLHNTLEAAVFGIPIFFGPKYSKFDEAVALVAQKGAFSILNSQEMIDKLTQFKKHPEDYQTTCSICKSFVNDNLGSVEKIMFTLHSSNSTIN